ncbi:DUF4232 domain-containing protein [Streptacidiphilus rugosus]|uniref:DUF4232 domain-containing protein n=1 Tax=Streptacidiphilus rugosus TaxID=405783 RepID=UPI00069128FC|nr:DUF4232 domain-containing protein [Streptacidiphilus rugosus]
MKKYSAFGILAASALCLTVSACTSTGSPAAGGTGSTTAPATAAATSGGSGGSGDGSGGTGGSGTSGSTGGSGGSSGGATATAAAGPAPCTGSQITVGAGQGDGAAGHLAVVLSFTNYTDHACTLHGYPGVAGLDSNDNQVAQARRTLRGMMGGAAPSATAPATVLVAAHSAVSARVEATDVPAGGATSCPTYAGLLVTPPGTRASTRIVSVQLPGCSGLEVHPVVPGNTGNQQ